MSVVQQYRVYRVGEQGVLIDEGFESDLEDIRISVENCNYSFRHGVEYVALPLFRGQRRPNR